MRIVHVIGSVGEVHGGPSIAALAMVEALAERGHDVDLLTTDVNGDGRLHVPLGVEQSLGRARVTFFPVQHPRDYATSLPLAHRLCRAVPSADVVHIHSLFLFHGAVAGHLCRQRRVPYVIRPHGALTRYQRSHHRVRKAIYTTLFERRNLREARGIHYTTAREAREAREAGVLAPAYVIPHGVEVPARLARRPPSGHLAGKRLVTFLGRITQKKRVDVAISAFAEVARVVPDAHLIVAGSDEGLGPGLRDLSRHLGVAERVTFTGQLGPREKADLLASSSVFILPSEDENFALALVEALAAGVPAVVAPGVHLHEEIEARGAGFSAIDVAATAAALSRILGSEDCAAAMSENAVAFARDRFSWPVVAKQLERMYTHVIATEEGLNEWS